MNRSRPSKLLVVEVGLPLGAEPKLKLRHVVETREAAEGLLSRSLSKKKRRALRCNLL